MGLGVRVSLGAPNKSINMLYKILKSDKRLGIKAGEVYNGVRHSAEKIRLDARVPDGYDPMCAQYMHEVAHRIKDTWMVIENNTYVEQEK